MTKCLPAARLAVRAVLSSLPLPAVTAVPPPPLLRPRPLEIAALGVAPGIPRGSASSATTATLPLAPFGRDADEETAAAAAEAVVLAAAGLTGFLAMQFPYASTLQRRVISVPCGLKSVGIFLKLKRHCQVLMQMSFRT